MTRSCSELQCVAVCCSVLQSAVKCTVELVCHDEKTGAR